MKPLLEFVPNFSEGRDAAKVDRIVQAMTAVPGAVLLGKEMDASHNRSVITLAGAPEAMAEAAFRGARAALAEIDLRQHVGEHKRMGAMDVCPFVPLGSADMALAVQCSKQVAARIGKELALPVFLYAEAATRAERRVLGNFRNKEFEGLATLVGSDPLYTPDHGPAKLHPTGGAVAVGARNFLIAYNVNLRSEDVALAKAISKQVREKDGGFRGIQAMGFAIEEKKCAQVSMNILDFRATSVRTIFDAVAAKAKAAGVEVLESELVGLIPAAAIDVATARHVKLAGFDPKKQVVEEQLAAKGIV